jgi:hypothetical protein
VPGAVLLAAVDENGKLHAHRALLLGGAGIAAAGAGMVSLPVIVVGTAVSSVGTRRAGISRGAAVLAMLALGVSATLVLLVRSAHDPALDAGNPETWAALLDVIARRQYAPSGLWPRQAPLWIQMGNLIQYLDWQFAMGVNAGVGPSALRTPITILFALLGLTGCLRHARDDRRSWMALAVVFVSATVGLVAYMNFKAGASFAWSFVPDGAGHEVRERDYFFALGFFVWGAWAGYGAVRLLSGRRLAWFGVALACVPILLNWRVANRRRLPEAALAHVAARAWLAPLPERAVLITGGDNDSFPLWYLQLVEGVRPDVTVITSPLLGADWYRLEVAERSRLLPVEAATSRMTQGERLRLLARRAATMGRPMAASAFVDSARRAYLARSWRFDGITFHADSGLPGIRRDLRQATRVSDLIPGYMLDREPLDTPDRAPGFMARTLRCPSLVVRSEGGGQLADSLDSMCNFR